MIGFDGLIRGVMLCCGGFFLAASPLLGTSMALADETGMATIHDWRTERGKTCLVDHFHSGSGEGRTKALARKAAISEWQGFTAWEYGTTWAYFSRAADKGVTYEASGSGWQATVQARPCKAAGRTRRSR